MIDSEPSAAGARPGRVLLPPPGNQRGLEVATGSLLEEPDCRHLLEQVVEWRAADPADPTGVDVGVLDDRVRPIIDDVARRLWEMNATLWQLDVVRIHPGDAPLLFRRPTGDPARDALDMAVVPHRKISVRVALDGPVELTVVDTPIRLLPGEMAAWPAFLPWHEPAIEGGTTELSLWAHGPALR